METNTNNEREELDLLTLTRNVWRRRWLVVIISGAFAVVACVYALLSPPVFRSQAVLTEVRETNGLAGGASSLMSQLGGLANLAGLNVSSQGDDTRTNQAVLKSRFLAEEYVRRNDLVPKLFEGNAEKPTVWRAVEMFKGGVLAITDDIRQGKTTVTVEWTDPVLAARWANGYVALANEILRQRALEEATKNVAYLNAQLQQTTVIDRQRVLYALIENETKTMMLANARAEYAFRVVDPAVVAELKVRPARTLIVLTGAVLGFFVSVAVVMVMSFTQKQRTNPPT